MTEHEKADSLEAGPTKTLNFDANQNQFSATDDSRTLQHLQSAIESVANRNPKTVRLYKCFHCRGFAPLRRMSDCLVICRKCYRSLGAVGHLARANRVERIANEIKTFLRRRVGV
jgi:hypothetical protein